MKNKNLYIMYAISFLQGLVFYGPVATLFRQSRGLTLSEIFLLESIFMMLMIVFEVPWGYFADRFGYKKTLSIAYFLFLLSKIVFYMSHSFMGFLIEAVIVALAISGVSGCDSAFIYECNKEEAEKSFGKYSAFSSAGFLIGAFLSTFMIDVSLDIPVILTIIPYAIAFLLIFFVKDVKYVRNGINMKDSFKCAFSEKNIFLFIISLALLGEVARALCVFLNQLKYIEVGINLKYFGILTAMLQIVGLASLKTYKISERFGQEKVIKIIFILVAVNTFILAYTSSYIITVLALIFIQGAFMLSNPLSMDIQNKSVTTDNRATILSIYAMTADIINSAINIAVGKATNVSLKFTFVFCGALIIVGFIFVSVYFKKEAVHRN